MTGGRPWTAEEDVRLADGVRAGKPHDEIAAELGRSIYAVRVRAHTRGLKMSPDAIVTNRRKGMDKFLADPVRTSAKARKLSARFTVEMRRALSEAMRGNTRSSGVWKGRHHTAEARAAIGQKHAIRLAKLIGVPRDHPLRALYREMQKKVGTADARRILRSEIERLSPFERQILRVKMGSPIVEKERVPTPMETRTLGGVSGGML